MLGSVLKIRVESELILELITRRTTISISVFILYIWCHWKSFWVQRCSFVWKSFTHLFSTKLRLWCEQKGDENVAKKSLHYKQWVCVLYFREILLGKRMRHTQTKLKDRGTDLDSENGIHSESLVHPRVEWEGRRDNRRWIAGGESRLHLRTKCIIRREKV